MANPTPVDVQRIRKFLGELDSSVMKLDFQEYRDSELAYPSESAVIFVNMTAPNILQIRGQWRGVTTDDESFAELTRQVHMCNVQRSGPKAYLLQTNQPMQFGLGAEFNLIVSKGATHDQLVNFYEMALTMIFGFFQDVERALPQVVTWKEKS